MTTFLRLTSTLAAILGFILALPGILLLLAASQIGSILVTREQAEHDRAIDSECR